MEQLASTAPSPYFAGTSLRFAWDQTSLGLLMECPRKFFLTMIEGWFKKDGGLHITFGKHFADAMERYYKRRAMGVEHELALDEVVWGALNDTWIRPPEGGEGYPWDSGDTKKNRFTLIRSIIWYLDGYNRDSDDPFKTVILSDGTPGVELLFTFASGIHCKYGEFVFTGHIDRLVDYDGSIFVLDNKTTGSALGAYYFSQFDTDNQMSQYTYAGKICYNVPVKGVIIDAAQIMVGFTAFGRGITTRTQGQLDEWHANAAIWLRLAEGFAETGEYPMNLKSCGNYGGCVFRGVCGKDPSIRDNYLKTEFEKRFWNPLDIR